MKTLNETVRVGGRCSRVLLGVVICVSALSAGFLAGLPTGAPPAAFAACVMANQACAGGDLTKTAVVAVNHLRTSGGGFAPVEPNTGETWSITASWEPTIASCISDVADEVATATVDWNGAGWTVSNVTLTANILAITVCDTSSCTGDPTGPVPTRSYKLMADVVDAVNGGVPPRVHALNRVVFATTAVDNGRVLDVTNCTLGSNVTPTSQTFSVTDTGAFECAFACNSVSGPSLTITY